MCHEYYRTEPQHIKLVQIQRRVFNLRPKYSNLRLLKFICDIVCIYMY